MDITASGAHVAHARAIEPIQIEKARTAGIQLRLAPMELIVRANQAFQRLTLNFHTDRFR